MTQETANWRKRSCYLPAKEETEMSSVCLVIIGLLLFAVTNGNETEQKEVVHRNRRSLANLNSMWTELSGTEGTKFINYGNWCGLGGSGTPVDPLDGCCQSHDFCYNEIEKTVCKDEGTKALYGKNYNYKIEDERATCNGYLNMRKRSHLKMKRRKSRGTGGNSVLKDSNKNDDTCAIALCLCDVVLNNCIKSNHHLYNTEHYHPISVYDALIQGNYIKSLL